MTEYEWIQNAQKVDNARGDTLTEICEEVGIDLTGVVIDRVVQQKSDEDTDRLLPWQQHRLLGCIEAGWDTLDAAVAKAIDKGSNTVAAFRVNRLESGHGKIFAGQAIITSFSTEGVAGGEPFFSFDTESGESCSGDISGWYFE